MRSHLFIRERDAGYGYDMTAPEAARTFPWLQHYWDLGQHVKTDSPTATSFNSWPLAQRCLDT